MLRESNKVVPKKYIFCSPTTARPRCGHAKCCQHLDVFLQLDGDVLPLDGWKRTSPMRRKVRTSFLSHPEIMIKKRPELKKRPDSSDIAIPRNFRQPCFSIRTKIKLGYIHLLML